MCTMKIAKTRGGRLNPVRVSLKDWIPVYHYFEKFLGHNANKAALFQLIVDKIPKFTQDYSTRFICSKLQEVTSDSKNYLYPLFHCNHEEADPRVLVHLNHGAENGIKRALIKTVDTDLLLLLSLLLLLLLLISQIQNSATYGWNLELVKKRDGCQFMVLLNTWLSKSVWHYFTGMLLQDVTLFPVSMVVEKKCLECVGKIF